MGVGVCASYTILSHRGPESKMKSTKGAGGGDVFRTELSWHSCRGAKEGVVVVEQSEQSERGAVVITNFRFILNTNRSSVVVDKKMNRDRGLLLGEEICKRILSFISGNEEEIRKRHQFRLIYHQDSPRCRS